MTEKKLYMVACINSFRWESIDEYVKKMTEETSYRWAWFSYCGRAVIECESPTYEAGIKDLRKFRNYLPLWSWMNHYSREELIKAFKRTRNLKAQCANICRVENETIQPQDEEFTGYVSEPHRDIPQFVLDRMKVAK